MYQMVYAVRDDMQNAYPELKESADRVAKVVKAEEEQFARTIVLTRLGAVFESLIDDAKKGAADHSGIIHSNSS